MNALLINCTLKNGNTKEKSSTDKLLEEVIEALEEHEIECDKLRALDYYIKPGVSIDEGEGDDWPEIREKLLKSDIFILATPIWLGQPSSVCKNILERLDAFLSDTDEKGRMLTYGKVAAVVIVGNEDGAHHVSSQLYQALNDVGFSLAANAVTYWVGEAMQGKEYKDFSKTPEKVDNATKMMTRNLVHLARLLKERNFPGAKE